MLELENANRMDGVHGVQTELSRWEHSLRPGLAGVEYDAGLVVGHLFSYFQEYRLDGVFALVILHKFGTVAWKWKYI